MTIPIADCRRFCKGQFQVHVLPCGPFRHYKFAFSAKQFNLDKMVSIIQGLLVSNPNYVYPLAINIVAATIPVWAGLQVGGARKRTGLKYPAEYWDGAIDEKTDREKFLFNCTQRAHQVNT